MSTKSSYRRWYREADIILSLKYSFGRGVELESCWHLHQRMLTLKEISITKTYYRTERQDVITEPKTKQSVRLIEIPKFLKQEIKDFIDVHYEVPENERLFPIVQEAVQHKMKHQMEKAGVKKIRVHDLRHSHIASLIEKGMQPLVIAQRVGHDSVNITMNIYGHLYPNKQKQVADLLNAEAARESESNLVDMATEMRFRKAGVWS